MYLAVLFYFFCFIFVHGFMFLKPDRSPVPHADAGLTWDRVKRLTCQCYLPWTIQRSNQHELYSSDLFKHRGHYMYGTHLGNTLLIWKDYTIICFQSSYNLCGTLVFFGYNSTHSLRQFSYEELIPSKKPCMHLAFIYTTINKSVFSWMIVSN